MSQNSSITPSENNNLVNLSDFFNTEYVSLERASALRTILLGELPKDAVRSHPGTGGKVFKYVDHVWVTKKLRQAFGALWGFEASEATIEEDGTATARGTLKVKFPTPDGNFIETVFSDYGACQTTKGMTMANRKLAAASKALVRCAFRAFGVGQDFYDSADDSLTPKIAWDMLMTQVKTHSNYVSKEDVVQYCKDNNIEKDALVERFEEVWSYIYKKYTEQRVNSQEVIDE